MRWCAAASLVYLAPKLSTTRENIMGKWVGAQSEGVQGTGVYPCLSIFKVRQLLAMMPDCLSPGMPFRISR